MPGVPAAVVQTVLDFIQPALSACVDAALVDEGQEGLGGLVAERRGVAEDDVNLPAAACERALDPALDLGIRLLVRPPRGAAQKAVLLIDAVRAADGDAAAAGKLVHLAVEGEEQVRVLRLHHDACAETLRFLVAQRSRGPRLVIAMDAQQCYRHRVYVPFELLVAVIEVVVDTRVAEDYQHVAARCMIVAAEARDALKAPMRVAGEIDVHFFLLI